MLLTYLLTNLLTYMIVRHFVSKVKVKHGTLASESTDDIAFTNFFIFTIICSTACGNHDFN